MNLNKVFELIDELMKGQDNAIYRSDHDLAHMYMVRIQSIEKVLFEQKLFETQSELDKAFAKWKGWV